jgi:2-polyprenyl-6-hydroxyphenyl methylase/3-demethylubiquinone-9 3-methyltransferase
LSELARVLRPGGVMYLSTTNKLCPVQSEYDLPLYSWYPARLKRHYERLAVTSRPELVSHATFPAVNWFTFGELRRFLHGVGVEAIDHLAIADPTQRGALGGVVVNLLKHVSPLRAAARVLVPYTIVFGVRR